MAGEIEALPCWGDIERKMIIAEFDRLQGERNGIWTGQV